MSLAKASLVDVARRAKVNISTVSRVINNTGKIGDETRAKVRKAMGELGYKPNRVARRLRSRSGARQLLGLIIPNIQNSFFADLARGVEDVAYKHNFAVFLCNYDEDPKKQLFYIDVMEGECVDGIILSPLGEEDPAVLKLVQGGVPLVCVDRSFRNPSVDKVEVDNERGAYEAVLHLIQRGHKHIGIVCGPKNTSTGRLRFQGYKKALADSGLPVNPAIVRFGDYKEGSGEAMATELLSLPKPPTALFVCNNLMTMGALEAIRKRELRIPEDVAIFGFDAIPLGNAFNPPLSLVHQPAYEVGSTAAELLLKRLAEPGRTPVSLKLMPELVVGRSS